jgi:hypothetical protein
MESIYTFTELKQMVLFSRELGYPTLKAHIESRRSELGESFNFALMEIYDSAMDIYTEKCIKHDYEHDFDFGPDSGSESVTCTKCGDHWSHTYY